MKTTHKLKKTVFRRWKVVHEAEETRQIKLDRDGDNEVMIVDGVNCHHSPSSGITLSSLPHKSLRSSGKKLSQQQLSFDKVIRKEPTFTEEASCLTKEVSFSEETTVIEAMPPVRSLVNIFESEPMNIN